jgi:hypothetical protein
MAASVIVVTPLVLAVGVLAIAVLPLLARLVAFVAVVFARAGTVAIHVEVTIAAFASGAGVGLSDLRRLGRGGGGVQGRAAGNHGGGEQALEQHFAQHVRSPVWIERDQTRRGLLNRV